MHEVNELCPYNTPALEFFKEQYVNLLLLKLICLPNCLTEIYGRSIFREVRMQRLITFRVSILLSIFTTALIACIPYASISADEEWAAPVDFTLPDVHGQIHSLSDFRGRWVIVNFWATWCRPCIQEIPDLRELSLATEPVQPVVIGIDFEEIDKEQLQKFMSELQMNYLVLIVGEAPLIPFEPLKGMPTTFIVSPDGYIAYRKIGATTKEMLLEQLQTLVKPDA